MDVAASSAVATARRAGFHRDDLEDVAQFARLRILEKGQPEHAAKRGYFAAFDWSREQFGRTQRRVHRTSHLEDLREAGFPEPAAPEAYADPIARKHLLDSIDALCERDRWIIEERFFRGRLQREIADDLSITESRACQLLASAIGRLRAVMLSPRRRVDLSAKEILRCKAFGAKLAASRIARGLTQSELGRKIGATQSRISSYELGRIVPSEEHMRKMSEALGQSLSLGAVAQDVPQVPGQTPPVEPEAQPEAIPASSATSYRLTVLERKFAELERRALEVRPPCVCNRILSGLISWLRRFEA